MKKIAALFLVLLMVLALGACSGEKDSKNSSIEKIGFVDSAYIFDNVQKHQEEKHESPDAGLLSCYDNLTSALLAMDKGEVTALWMNQTLAEYTLAQSDKYGLYSGELDDTIEIHSETTYGMLTMESNTEVYELLDRAIKQLKADGTLDELIENELLAYIDNPPVPAEIPEFEGAASYKIAITGDLPPTDFITADGKAAGFNVALLAAIAEMEQVNFELVPVSSTAKAVALTSGTVDAVFWMPYPYNCSHCGEAYAFSPEGTILTEPYFTDSIAVIQSKSAE
ncbi:MAG: transporter substrate-binding domain-containing protein [Bacillota bacterium]|nr:transporter substrate-binding domain-containing protein [Bacillota bacterium]